jgi:dihydrofolate reductase
MRKLKLQVQMSVDGYIAGINGEMDFLEQNWDAKIGKYVTDITAPVDCIVLGRKLAQGFIPHWASNPGDAGAAKINSVKKVVFTHTLAASEWDNTVLAKGDLVDEITALKKQSGQDIIAYGGATFVSALVQHGLIDEYHLFVNPTALGIGMPIFQGLEHSQALRLVRSISFDCGIVVLHYELKRD